MSWVVTNVELDATIARYGRPTLWANIVLHKPPRFPGAVATRAFFIRPDLMALARTIDRGDEIDIAQNLGPEAVLTIESMVGFSLVRKGPVDWRQWHSKPIEPNGG